MYNRPYLPLQNDYLYPNHKPSFQTQFPKKFINHEIERNIRQSIKWDLLSEYDEAINECYDLLAEIEKDYQNSILRDSRNIYLTYNGKVYINQLYNLSEIENELSHINNRKAVKIIENTEDIVEQKRKNPQIIYLPIFLIPNKIEPQFIFDIYSKVKDGNTYFNFFTYTPYLEKRLNSNFKIDIKELDTLKRFTFEDIDINKKSFYNKLKNQYLINLFLWHFTKNNKSEFIEEWLRYFFKTLRRIPQSLVLVGNRDVSEEMFYNAIIKQIFGHEYCITLSDDILENENIEYIVREKLFIHINYIPENKNHQSKLKNLLDALIVYDYSKGQYGNSQYLCQIIFTLDAPHPFLNDYLSSSKIFFIDSLSNINQKLDLPDRISLLNNINKNLENFSEQLSGNPDNIYYQHKNYIDIIENEVINQRKIHYTNYIVLNDTVSFEEKDYTTDNELYKNWIKNPDLMQFALTFNSANPILDPFHNSFEELLPKKDRCKHTYITGKTGSGKSELLKTLIYRDILSEDCSVILLDIHGDLAKEVTRLVKDKERLVLIDPILEKDFTPTINLFDTKDKSEENIEQVSQMISSVINSINVGDTLSGTMIDVLENCIPVLIRDNNKDFYDLKSFMKTINKENSNKKITLDDHLKSDDEKYNKLVKLSINSKNEFEKDYFNNEFINVSAATKNAVKRRLNKMLKNTLFSNLTNGKSTIDLEKEMNTKGKIIIFNIPKAKMLNTYTYYIKFIIGLIQIIALKRAAIKNPEKRPHTHLYIDEFHNFITPTIEEILTESRKYKLFLTFAHQSISQIKDANLRDIILDNTNVKIVGKNSNKTLEMMNKTLNTKLEDVQKLTAGVFNLQSGTNDVIKIRNTDKLLGNKEWISEEQWEEHKQYQFKMNYYRSTIKEDIINEFKLKEINDLDKMIDEFIQTIKAKDLSETSCLRRIEHKRFEEIKSDFSFEKDGIKQPRIRQQEINIVFQLAFNQDEVIDKNEFFKKLKEKDLIFEDTKMMTQDKKYRDKNQEKYYLIPV